jgi:hypothetical protein
MNMKRIIIFLSFFVLAASTSAAVQVYVEDVNGLAAIKYACTADETVRAFALDVSVDAGTIVGISGFHIGESTALARGYGIFPAAFSRSIEIDPETGEPSSWDVNDYTPLADPRDCPEGTLAGLETNGVTLEFGGLWELHNPVAIPGPTGILCLLQLSDAANVSVSPNIYRGGVVLTNATTIQPEALGAFVDPANMPPP